MPEFAIMCRGQSGQEKEAAVSTEAVLNHRL